MELKGEHKIHASQSNVWNALNDPDTLKNSIPGCQSIEKVSDTVLNATVIAKVGPVKATFRGTVTLSNINPPHGYTITGNGQGGAIGFGSGCADIKLVKDGEETILSYNASAQVGGKLAQIGQRLVESTARSMTDQFFAKFSDNIAKVTAAPITDHTAENAATDEDGNASEDNNLTKNRSISNWTWVFGIIALIILLLFIYDNYQ